MPSSGSKNMMSSLTIWGAIQMALSVALAIAQSKNIVTPDEAAGFMANAKDLLVPILGISGFISTIIGRFRAKKKVTVI